MVRGGGEGGGVLGLEKGADCSPTAAERRLCDRRWFGFKK